MQFINFFSNFIIPFIIFLIMFYGILEKIPVFDLFIVGVKEGIEIVFNIFPTLLGLFLAIELLRKSDLILCISNIIYPIFKTFGFPKEILGLMLLRPISGSGAIAMTTDIMKTYGVDSNIGIIASTMMGATETTIYVIALYTSSVKVKKIRFVLLSALIADFVRNVSCSQNLSIHVERFLLTFRLF